MSSTVSPGKSRDFWYVRATPSLGRMRAGRFVTSVPMTSIVPLVGQEVTGDQVEQRRLARAVRAQDRAALAVRDVEIDVAHGLHPAEAPADPPQAEDRAGAFGGDGSRRLSQRVTVTRRLDLRDLPGHGPFTHAGTVSPGGGFDGEKTPPKLCGTPTTL